MTDQSPFLVSVREIRRLTSSRAPPIDSFLQLSLLMVSWRSRENPGIRHPRPPVRTLETSTPMQHRDSLDRHRPSDPTKADPHDLDEEKEYSPDTPSDEQGGQRR